ncbi:MAG: hydrolase [Piscirickettsiaceae bacterium]|nr:hydrolase [Piscirickettsiaceae bacterium]
MERRASLLVNEKDSVFVVIDVQEKLLSAMPSNVQGRIVEQINKLLKASNSLSIPVVITEQYPAGLGHSSSDLFILDDTVIIEKTSFSCVQEDDFCKQLERFERKQIILTGMESHICILQTAFDLQTQGYQVYVVEDAISSRSKANQYNALQRLRNAGIVVTNVDSVIFEWLGDAKHPEFKTLAKLIV